MADKQTVELDKLAIQLQLNKAQTMWMKSKLSQLLIKERLATLKDVLDECNAFGWGAPANLIKYMIKDLENQLCEKS